ncbi:hypothetical protein CEF21_21230 [Bacillus sp. FJAT-42376]|uniref:hypothetical protein n=1 Tax=Bacillus sp. FJAT-42376 TaxID=2014076 RepID=UPI000F50823F|nr:hypothetical protein [Bacillus sp. FJAT-42376]AZB44605.1 hypothetical protein CEF21_21230 [Bacillus sp. FJAT-42376]
MKNGLFIWMGVCFLLSGCVINEKPREERPAADEKQPDPAPPVQEKPPAVVPEEPAEPPVTDEPDAVVPDEPAVPDTDGESLQYLDEVAPMLEQLSAGLYAFGQLNLEASNDPSLLTDSGWVKELADSLVQMQGASDDLKALEPPASMAEVHQLFLLAGKEIDYVVEHYPGAIDTMDLAEIEQCTEALLNTGLYLDKASALLGASSPSY